MVQIHRIPDASHCPACAHLLNAAGGRHAEPPRAGDFTVCLYCRVYLVFEAGGSYHRLSTAEWGALTPGIRAELEHVRATMPTLEEPGSGSGV
jgi:hypothetical protein